MAVLALTGLMLALDITITNVALPTIQQALHTTTQDLQWVVNAYALAGAAVAVLLLPTSGRIRAAGTTAPSTRRVLA